MEKFGPLLSTPFPPIITAKGGGGVLGFHYHRLLFGSSFSLLLSGAGLRNPHVGAMDDFSSARANPGEGASEGTQPCKE